MLDARGAQVLERERGEALLLGALGEPRQLRVCERADVIARGAEVWTGAGLEQPPNRRLGHPSER